MDSALSPFVTYFFTRLPWLLLRLSLRPEKRLCRIGGIPRRHGSRPWSCAIFAILSPSPRKAASRWRQSAGCIRRSRRIRDLEYEVGAQLLVRNARGVELTGSGRVFLDHARLALAQVEAAVEAARRAAQPSKPTLALGFLTGQEMDWLPEVMRILRDELPNIEVSVSSQYSPDLARALMRGKLDLAFMRPETQMPDLIYRDIVKEPLIVAMPSDHRLASQEAIALRDIAGETFIGMSNTAPTLRVVIEEYLERMGIDLPPAHRVDNLAMAMSLIASTKGVALLPAYARNFHAVVRDQQSSRGRAADDRSRHRL